MVIQLGHQILNGQSPRLFKESNKIFRDFIFIDDITQANIKACDPKRNGVFNIGTGIPRSFQNIADILQKELKTNLQIEYFPNKYDNYQMHTQADISSAKDSLNFEPAISLEDGIKAYIPEIKKMYSHPYS
jgi:ADP-L-glycero-D-manno-heptose 6-epimerase